MLQKPIVGGGGAEIHDECELGIIIGKRARTSLKAVAAR